MLKKSKTLHPTLAAGIGFLFIFPFIVMNSIVGSRIEPFFSLLRPGIHTSTFEYILLFIVLFLIPIGAFISIRPMIYDGKLKFYIVNGVVAAILLIVFMVLTGTLGSEIYRCEILQIPNCD